MFKHLPILAVLFFAAAAFAQDSTVAEPSHYRVAFENERVRVVDVHYGPHEKSGMHQHPAGVLVYITEAHFRLTDEHGNVTEPVAKAGDARWFPAFKHRAENTSEKSFDGVYIELKTAAPR